MPSHLNIFSIPMLSTSASIAATDPPLELSEVSLSSSSEGVVEWRIVEGLLTNWYSYGLVNESPRVNELVDTYLPQFLILSKDF
jgi:hypothetical protein